MTARGGYWRYPHSSNIAPVPGLPGEGDTNTGLGEFFDVGSYLHEVNPWGLLDGSGGESEWLENMTSDGVARLANGSSWAGGALNDELDRFGMGLPTAAGSGLRLASVIPGPATGFVAPAAWALVSIRRRVRARAALATQEDHT